MKSMVTPTVARTCRTWGYPTRAQIPMSHLGKALLLASQPSESHQSLTEKKKTRARPPTGAEATAAVAGERTWPQVPWFLEVPRSSVRRVSNSDNNNGNNNSVFQMQNLVTRMRKIAGVVEEAAFWHRGLGLLKKQPFGIEGLCTHCPCYGLMAPWVIEGVWVFEAFPLQFLPPHHMPLRQVRVCVLKWPLSYHTHVRKEFFLPVLVPHFCMACEFWKTSCKIAMHCRSVLWLILCFLGTFWM